MDLDSLNYPPGLCPRNVLLVDEVRDSRAKCFLCHESWQPKGLRVHQRSRMYHLPCFQPDHFSRILLKDVRQLGICERNQRTFDNWLSEYNQKFRTVSQAFLETLPFTQDAQGVRKRQLLEVFKFCSIKEIALVLPLVCLAWRQHSYDSEVWVILLLQHYPRLTASSHPRDVFVRNFYLTCYACKTTFPSDADVPSKHPVTGQPLCEECVPKQFFNSVTVQSYCEYLGVTENYLTASGVRMFSHKGKSYVMPFEVRKKITDFRRRRLNEKMDVRNCEWVGLESVAPEATYHQLDAKAAIEAAESPNLKEILRQIFFRVDNDAPPPSLKRKATRSMFACGKKVKVGRKSE